MISKIEFLIQCEVEHDGIPQTDLVKMMNKHIMFNSAKADTHKYKVKKKEILPIINTPQKK